MIHKDHNGVRGHTGGHQGATAGTGQNYIELLAGDACGEYTSANNTTGTFYFDQIEYFFSFKNYSINLIGNNLATAEVSAESLIGDNISRAAANGYNPDGPAIHYIDHEALDEIFGRFNRIAFFKTAASNLKGRLLVTFGPQRTLVKESYGA